MEGANNFLDGADALLSAVHRSKQAEARDTVGRLPAPSPTMIGKSMEL